MHTVEEPVSDHEDVGDEKMEVDCCELRPASIGDTPEDSGGAEGRGVGTGWDGMAVSPHKRSPARGAGKREATVVRRQSVSKVLLTCSGSTSRVPVCACVCGFQCIEVELMHGIMYWIVHGW